MRKKELYTAVGRFERRTNRCGQTHPVILLGGNEYMADLQEMAVWACLNWRIARRKEIRALYERTVSPSGFTAQRPLDACIDRLLARGLLVRGTGETDFDALYDLLAPLYVIPMENSLPHRAASFLKSILSGLSPLAAAGKFFRRDKRPEQEQQIMGLAAQALLSTAELIKCAEKNIRSLPSEESILDSLYDDDHTTSDNLPFLAWTFPSCRTVIPAVASLYLRQQIIFESI